MTHASSTRQTVLEDELFVESRVLRGRVKKKHVALERTVSSSVDSNSARGTTTLRVGKALCYTLDPSAVLITSSEQRCGRFQHVAGGHLFPSSSRASPEDLELFYIELSTSDGSWGQDAEHGVRTVRLCFESRSALDTWHEALVKEVYRGNSIHKLLRKDVEQEDADAGGSMWESFLHINGISVYTQREQIRQGSGSEASPSKNDTGMMSSVVIRNSPAMCLKVLLQESLSFDSSWDPRIGGTLAFSDSLEVIKRVDRYSSLVRMQWSCSTADMVVPCLLWPRECIMLRTWRKSDDGTYIIVYQPANASKKYGVSRGCVEADAVFGFTIAPLREEYRASASTKSMGPMKFSKASKLPQHGHGRAAGLAQRPGEQHVTSPESLVTLVINADVGGFAGSNSLLSKLSPLLHRKVVIAMLKPLVMSLVLMRDRLEQSRFVVMPSMFSQEEEDLEEEDSDWIDVSESSASIKPVKVESGLMAVETELVAEVAIGADGTPREKLARRSIQVSRISAIPTVYGQYGCTDRKFWSYPGYDYLKIRGKSYLEDRVKVRADKPVFELYSSDLVNSERVMLDIAKDLPSIQYCDAPYVFVLNLVFPNKPLQNLVTAWTCPVDPTKHTVDELVAMYCFPGTEPVESPSTSGADCDIPTPQTAGDDASLRAFFKTFKEWIQGDEPVDDERRNKKFKLIPRIARGSWVIKQAVGTTPVLLGQKLETRYFRGRTARGCNYFEVDVDITSNPVANNITKLVVNSITSLVVDLAPLIEGQDADDLPERLIGSVRYNHLDLTCASAFARDGRGGLEPTG